MEQTGSAENSPFTPPRASLEQTPTMEYDTSSPFSSKGRFGRIDFLAFSALSGMAMMVIAVGLGVVMAISGSDIETLGPIILLITLPSLYFGILFMIRRLHDLNWSGWFAVTYIIPLVNLVMLLILSSMKGTPTSNSYGPPRQPPSKIKIAIALILPAIFMIGMLAAIALPAYQDYVLRAQGL